jgi:hypothetical protein
VALKGYMHVNKNTAFGTKPQSQGTSNVAITSVDDPRDPNMIHNYSVAPILFRNPWEHMASGRININHMWLKTAVKFLNTQSGTFT